MADIERRKAELKARNQRAEDVRSRAQALGLNVHYEGDGSLLLVSFDDVERLLDTYAVCTYPARVEAKNEEEGVALHDPG